MIRVQAPNLNSNRKDQALIIKLRLGTKLANINKSGVNIVTN